MALTRKENESLLRFRNRARASLSDPKVEMKLFGSKARGDDHADSDLDVLVLVSADDWTVRDKVCALATDELLDAGILISPKAFSRREWRQLRRDESPFVRNVLRDAIPIK